MGATYRSSTRLQCTKFRGQKIIVLVGGKTSIDPRVVLNGVVFKSTLGSLNPYCFCEENDPFKVPKSQNQGPCSLFLVSLRNNMLFTTPGFEKEFFQSSIKFIHTWYLISISDCNIDKRISYRPSYIKGRKGQVRNGEYHQPNILLKYKVTTIKRKRLF